jgi:hypothetical protein
VWWWLFFLFGLFGLVLLSSKARCKGLRSVALTAFLASLLPETWHGSAAPQFSCRPFFSLMVMRMDNISFAVHAVGNRARRIQAHKWAISNKRNWAIANKRNKHSPLCN